jgi:hypothetical protein
VINTLLSSGGDRAAALEFWDLRRAIRASSHQAWSAERYAEARDFFDTNFWRARASQALKQATVLSATPLPETNQRVQLSFEAGQVQSACLVDETVRRMECLTHPNVLEPVAYVDGVFLSPLLHALKGPTVARDLIAAWTSFCPPDRALAVLGWLWRREILVAG